MKDSLSIQDSDLFKNISAEDIQNLYECFPACEKIFKKGAYVFRVGDSVGFVYLILSGSVHITNEDFWGNQTIIETMKKDTLFGEAYVFSNRENHLVNVVAAEDSVILKINPSHLFEICSKECECHTQLIRNALGIVSEKIVRLTEKLGHVTQRTIREKLLSYLSKCAQLEGNKSFYVPYSRQQLADYLCVDRSALSHELSRLQNEGLINYQKNYFELLVNHGSID